MHEQTDMGMTRREAVGQMGRIGGLFALGPLLTMCTHARMASPIGWQPRLQYPVFHGVRDLGLPDGLLGPLRLFYPTTFWRPENAPVLRPQYRYPVVLFLHGNCSENDHYQRWQYLPQQLARSGYVVAVPDLPAIRHGMPPSVEHPDLAILLRVLDFLRAGWTYAALVEPAPATAVIGHSYGAAVGAYLIRSRPDAFAAFASLSGAVEDVQDPFSHFGSLGVPAFYLHGFSEARLGSSHDLLWPELPAPKHLARLENFGHWDYLPPRDRTCATMNGAELIPSCPVDRVAADLVATFVGKYVGNPLTALYGAAIPDSFRLRTPEHSEEQQRFLNGYLTGLAALDALPAAIRQRCACARLDWQTSRGTSTRTLP